MAPEQPAEKVRLWRRLGAWIKGLDRTGKRLLAGASGSLLAGILLAAFEPWYPWHAPLAAISFIAAIVLWIKMGNRYGFPVFTKLGGWCGRHKRLVISVSVIGGIFYICFLFAPLGPSPFSGLSEAELQAKIDTDYAEVKQAVFQVDTALRGLKANAAVFAVKDIQDLAPEDRTRVTALWAEFAGYMLYFDEVISQYRFFYRIFYPQHPFLHNKAYLTGYTAFVTRFLCGTELLNLVHGSPVWETILNDAIREQNIPGGVYAAMRDNVIDANDVARLTVGYMHLHFLKTLPPGFRVDDFDEHEGEMFDYIEQGFARCSANLALKSAVWFPQNGVDRFKEESFKVWFPLQKTAAGATGHLRFTRRRENFIQPEHLARLDPMLQPGDILVERRNWYLSNVGIPGFWPHAAIYLGPREKFLAYFQSDPGVAAVVGEGGVEAFMAEHCSKVWNDYHDDMAVIESVEPGVVLHSLRKSAGADYTAAMRPRLAKKDTFLALCAAFAHYGKPYDYNFDFITDSALVCTELVWKSYKTAGEKHGVDFPLEKHAGRDLCTAQLMVQTYAEQSGTPGCQLDFVAFLDYDAAKQEVVWAPEEVFRASCKRAKWSMTLE